VVLKTINSFEIMDMDDTMGDEIDRRMIMSLDSKPTAI
jgi:hypothetical protein